MRRLTSLLLAVAVVCGACGSDDADAEDASPTTEPAATVVASPPPEPTPAPGPTTTAAPEPAATPSPPRFFTVDDLAFDEQLVEQPVKVFDDPINWEIRPAPGGGVYLASGWDGPPSPTSGVYFTDGVGWTLFDQEFLCGLLAVDTGGQLWATCPDFLTRLVDVRWVNVAEGPSAASVAAGPDASVWFVTNSGPGENRLLRFDGARWVTVGPCEDCVGPRSIVGVDLEGGAWVARGGCGLAGLTRFDAAGSTEDFDIRGARDAAFAADGSVWLALPCDDEALPAGVARYVDGEVRVFTTDDGLPSNIVQAVELGPDGSLYAGTELGVSRYVPNTETWVPVGHR